MHETSFITMSNFHKDFVKKGSRVLDVGSRDINGAYKPIFLNCEYVGLDIQPGTNVDVLGWGSIEDESFDFVISGQTFEHVEDDFALMQKIYGALKPGGMCCIIAPSIGPEHDYPKDYRRYKPEYMRKLAKSVNLKVLTARLHGEGMWNDCTLIAKKEGNKGDRDE